MSDSNSIEKNKKELRQSRMKRNIISFSFLIILLVLTLWSILKDSDIEEICELMFSLEPSWFCLSAAAAIFFVSAEGFMIWYILKSLKCKVSFFNCIGYSFVGFFFSGITPSASGGQPMQLYYMSKDKLKISDSTVALTIVAIFYKFILVIIGIVLALFWGGLLNEYLGVYIYLFWFGLVLNFVVVVILFFLMASPEKVKKILLKCERLIVKLHILKPSVDRIRKLSSSAYEYNNAVMRFVKNLRPVIVTAVFTVFQRCSIFFITYFIYKGMGFNSYSMLTITVLQASVYIAVDLLPLPGAQGISELMYKTVFSSIFLNTSLPASVLVTRGVSFYLPLVIGIFVTILFHITRTVIKDKNK